MTEVITATSEHSIYRKNTSVTWNLCKLQCSPSTAHIQYCLTKAISLTNNFVKTDHLKLPQLLIQLLWRKFQDEDIYEGEVK